MIMGGFEPRRTVWDSAANIEIDESDKARLMSGFKEPGFADRQKAAAQAALFADEKDDPMASTSTLSFLRSHPELSGESVPWHLHSADETAAAAVDKR